MRSRTLLVALFALLALSYLLAAPPASTLAQSGGTPEQEGTPSPRSQDAVVQAVLFWREGCGYCHYVLEQVMPGIYATYGDQFELRQISTDDPVGLHLYQAAADHFNIPQAQRGVPLLVIGETVLQNAGAIEQQLPGEIDRYLAQGGVGWPDLTGRATPQPVPTPSPTGLPIHLAYFYQPGCQECSRTEIDLEYMQSLFPQLVVHRFDVKEDAELNQCLSTVAGLDERLHLTAPSIFVGDHGLAGDEVTVRDMEALIGQYAATGSEAFWEGLDTSQCGQVSIIERFKEFTPLTVLVAGLFDGLNPCAFATLVFFLSYMTATGRKGREILLVGGAFTLGVFVTYTAVGVGVWRLVSSIPGLDVWGKVLYTLTALVCAVLAVFSFRDFLKARQGQIKDMSLVMPDRLRSLANRIVRRGAGMRSFVLSALATGAAVSLVEFACTGQVYLPTIVVAIGTEETAVYAVLYLILYNLMFIMPLIVVFLLSYFGTSSMQLGLALKRYTAQVKLATTLVFALLAGWLVVLVLHSTGVIG